MRRTSGLSTVLIAMLGTCAATQDTGRAASAPMVLVETTPPGSKSALYEAFYTHSEGLEMLGPGGLSADAGRTWKSFTPTPDFSAGLPDGYRREPFPGVVDPVNGRIVRLYNAMDTPGLDPSAIEPIISLNTYYLRYSVSTDAGRTWLFDEPVIQEGHTEATPFDGVHVGKNAIFLGDIGSVPIFTREGNIIVAANPTLLGENGELAMPAGNVTTYTDVLPIVGTWDEDNRIKWQVSQRIVADPKRTTRGFCEPTLAEMPDGRILMVMRGSNGGPHDPEFKIPSYKWYCISSDGGHTWTDPAPWTYDTGEAFFSPSSMSMLTALPNGRVFWTGNISETNARANDPRWPLVLGEVDPETLLLKKSTVQTVDTRGPGDPEHLNISHCRNIVDRQTGDLLLLLPRSVDQYQSFTWKTYRYREQR